MYVKHVHLAMLAAHKTSGGFFQTLAKKRDPHASPHYPFMSRVLK